MGECVIHKALLITLALLAHLDDTFGEYFACRCSLIIGCTSAAGRKHAS
jgi:hypothetical protein